MRPPRKVHALPSRCAALGLWGLLFGGGCAATQLPDEPVLKDHALAQRVFEMKSGLRVLVQEDHTSPQVVVTSTFAVGSKDDPVGKEGLAHFVEHLAFRSKPGGEQVWDHLKRTGGAFNAFTAADITEYYTITHKDQLPFLLQLEAWRLARTLEGVTEDVFKVEREVVRNELRQRGETTVGSKVFDETLKQMFPKGHPLGRTLAGTPESMLATQLEDAKAFVKQHYTPDNCTMVIAGDVNPDEVAKLLGMWPAEVLFGPDGPEGPAVKPRKRFNELPTAEPPPPVNTKLVKVKGPVLEPLLMIGWSLPGGLRGKDSKISFAAQALNVALGMGLERKFKDALQGVGAFGYPMVDGSIMVIQASLKQGADPEKIRRRLLDAVANTWAGDEDVRLTQQAYSLYGKWGTATELVRASGDLVTSALGLAEHLAATGRYTFFKDSLEDLASVKNTDVKEFAYKYLKRERAVAVLFEPEHDEVNASASPAGGGHRFGAGSKPNISGMGPDELRQILRKPELAGVAHVQLENGLTLYTVPRKNMPVARIKLRLPGGNATTQPYALARFAKALSYTRCQNHGSLFPVGGRLWDSGGDMSSTVDVEVLAGNLVNGLAVMADTVSCQEASEEYLMNAGEAFDAIAERMTYIRKRQQYKASARLWQELYPGHPYGQIAENVDEIRRVRFSEFQAFIQGHYRPDAAVAVVVGDVSAPEVEVMARKYLGPWTRGRSGASTAPPVPAAPAERKVIVYDRPGASQTMVGLACRLADTSAETLPAADLAESILTESLWELREAWGATYGMYAAIDSRPGGTTHMAMGGAIETPQTGAGLKAMLDLVAKTADAGPNVVTFTSARWDLARAFNRRFADADAAGNAILTAVANGWSPVIWDEYPERLATLTRADVKSVVEPCAEHEIVVLLGDAKVIGPQLEAQGLTVTETVEEEPADDKKKAGDEVTSR